MSKLFSAISDTSRKEVPKDKLDQIRAMAKNMRNLKQEIEDDTARLNEKKQQLFNLTTQTLPEMFAEADISSISLEPEGNNPGVDLDSVMNYKAVLPKNEETGEVLPAGLDWLERNQHGDLIKRVFTIELPMDSVDQAKALRAFLSGKLPVIKETKTKEKSKTKKKEPAKPKKFIFPYVEERTVHWTTLTSFVKEQIEKHKKVLPLDILGATVGKIVKLKVKKAQR